jgi:hypothetical protein
MVRLRKSQMKISKLDKPTVRAIEERLNVALRAVLQEFGLEGRMAGGRFDDATATLKIEIKAPEAAQKSAADDWARWAQIYDLPADAVGKPVHIGGRFFTVVGINAKARVITRRILIRDSAGKTFTCSPKAIAASFGGFKGIGNV